jgi:hypothetical protein
MNVIKILSSIVTFLLRRRDFLSVSINIIIGAIVRELSAIGFSEGAIELVNEVKQQTAIYSWKYWGIRILEVALLGGSWIVFAILMVILVGLSWLKYKTRAVPAIKHHFNSNLRSIEKLIKEFKSITATNLLDQIKKDIEDSYLSKNDREELLAWAYHLLGLCRGDEQNAKKSYQYHIQSYLLSPNNVMYKERACISYYQTDQKKKASQLATEILEQDGLNERASVVRLHTDQSFDLSSIPKSVKEEETFKRLFITFLLPTAKLSDLQNFLSDELIREKIPTDVNFENIDFWDLVGRVSFLVGKNNQPNQFASEKEDYTSNHAIKYSNKILGLVLNKVFKTELYNNYKAFKVTAFYFYESDYLLNGNPDSVSEMLMLYKLFFLKEKFSSELAITILISLNQLHRHEDVLALTATIDRSDFFVHLMEFIALSGLHRNEEAKKSYQEYISRLDIVRDIDVNNLISYSDFLIQNNEDVSGFYTSYVECKTFELDQHKDIVFCYFHRYIPEKTESIRNKLTSLITIYSEMRHELKNTFLITSLAIKEFQLTTSLIEKYHNWKVEKTALAIYTECLLQLRNDSSKLLEILKYRRDHLPKEHLFIQEITIYELIENANEILDICRQAQILYPQNPNFKFYFIHSLYKLNEDGQLNDLLTNELLEKPFSWKQKFLLARICIEKGKKLLGLELFYQETKQNGTNSPIIKQSYFILTTLISDREDIAWPEVIEIDTVAKVKTSREEILLTIDEKNRSEHWIVKHILGRRRGECARVYDPITHKNTEVRIVHIFDKYSGLSAQIADEVGKSNLTGMDIRSVHFESTDTESITKTLIEAFGEAGDRDKIRIDEAFKKYYNGKLSFTELVRSTSSDKVFEIYSHLTSTQSEGFVVLPIRDFNNVPIKEDSELVIDFTSLPILMKLSEEFPNLIRHKFIISQFAIEFVENELIEARAMREDGMTVAITSFAVKPTLYPPGYKEYKVSTFEKILEWIKMNCETRFSKEKLDMILQKPDIVKQTDLYHNYLVDTIFISHKRTLISDDRIHNQNFKTNYLTVSLEYYLQYFYNQSFKNDILPVLIQNHYIGIKLDAETLMKEFKKPFYGGTTTFHYCLQNLPFSVNHDLTVFNEALDFVKAIYTEQMPIEFKKETSQKVLVNALKNYPSADHLRKNIINEIKSRFSLLQIYLIDVLDDFNVALAILKRSK